MKLKPIDQLTKDFLLKLIEHYETTEGMPIQLIYGDLLITAIWTFCESPEVPDDYKERFQTFKELLT